jgi:hypothetical protein
MALVVDQHIVLNCLDSTVLNYQVYIVHYHLGNTVLQAVRYYNAAMFLSEEKIMKL